MYSVYNARRVEIEKVVGYVSETSVLRAQVMPGSGTRRAVFSPQSTKPRELSHSKPIQAGRLFPFPRANWPLFTLKTTKSQIRSTMNVPFEQELLQICRSRTAHGGPRVYSLSSG